jgi:hypothetical protein
MHRNRDPLVAAAGFGERGRCDEEGRHRIGVGLRSSWATIVDRRETALWLGDHAAPQDQAVGLPAGQSAWICNGSPDRSIKHCVGMT